MIYKYYYVGNYRMKQRRQAFEKITKYSIRKLSVGVGPVAIGALLFAGSVVSPEKFPELQINLNDIF